MFASSPDQRRKSSRIRLQPETPHLFFYRLKKQPRGVIPAAAPPSSPGERRALFGSALASRLAPPPASSLCLRLPITTWLPHNLRGAGAGVGGDWKSLGAGDENWFPQ